MEGKTSAGFTIFCTVFSVIIHAVKWQPSSGYKHACILLVVILFFTLSTHVTVPVIQWELKVNHAMPATPRYQCLLGNTEENELFLCECVYWSFPQVDSWLYQPRPLAIQLSLKDSSCAVLDPYRGALCAPAHRGATVIDPGDSLSQQSQLDVTHLWGISSKQVQRQGDLA